MKRWSLHAARVSTWTFSGTRSPATGVLDQALAPFFFGGPDPLSDDAPDPLRGLLERTNRLAEKDLDQALVLAKTFGATVPVIEAVRQSFARVVRL